MTDSVLQNHVAAAGDKHPKKVRRCILDRVKVLDSRHPYLLLQRDAKG